MSALSLPFPLVAAFLCVLLPLGAQAAVAEHDVVVLTNGHQVTGRVSEATATQVTIEQAHGSVQLPRILVQAVHLSFSSRRARLDQQDYEAVMSLAQWARDHELFTEAEELARRAYALPERDARAALLIAQLLDAQPGQQQAAMEYYQAYRDRYGGSDPAVLSRLQDLERHFRDYEQQLADYQQALTQAQENHVNGLEASAGWQGDDPQHANQINVEQQTIDQSGIENKVLHVRYVPGDQHKAVLRRRVTFNASEHNHLSFLVQNPEDHALPLSIAVKAGPDYVYYESPPVTIPPTGSDWHSVSFPLTSADWKSEASNWRHAARIGNLENIRELQIQFHNQRRDGSALVDNIPLLR